MAAVKQCDNCGRIAGLPVVVEIIDWRSGNNWKGDFCDMICLAGWADDHRDHAELMPSQVPEVRTDGEAGA